MVKITKKVEYALMALNYLESSTEPVSVKRLSEELQLPFDTVSHVLQSLAKAQVTQSFQGSQGGHRLIIDLSSLSFKKLSEIIEKKPFSQDCEQQNCKLLHCCSIKTPINKLYSKVESFFDEVKIADLLGANL